LRKLGAENDRTLMKRLLFLAGIVVLGTALVSTGAFIYLSWVPSTSTASAEVCPPPRPLKPLPDVDALAARMKKDQDIYQKVRDEALAAYAKVHPTAAPYDDEARMALRLVAYLDIWGDYYGENLWSKLSDHADNLLRKGSRDLSWQVYYDVNRFTDSFSITEEGAERVNHEMLAYGGTAYPALFKLAGYRTAMNNLVSSKPDPNSRVNHAFDALPDLVGRSAGEYQHLIESHFSPAFLFFQGRDLLDAVHDDEVNLRLLSEDLDRAFATADPASAVGDELDGEFYLDDAWCARGSGYANTVTPEGWQLFGERLQHAEKILTALYAKYPQDAMIPSAMMTVVLGEQQPRDQMELWFQRGLQADPDSFRLYMQKRWYLLPRWYGSDDEVWAFGEECAASTNWAAKIPLILVEAISDAGDRDPSVYGRPEIWAPLEKVYRAYLERYPDSATYRSRFARNAVQGEHWEVAKEQFKILGDDWDHTVFKGTEYAEMTALANAH
jgi:hypothetical protein